ncbi:MAG: T9SS type A sorting domain-containing protein [Chitinophagaceae bacterium]|nr:T9SS type A sorting domain-containing protein [Chitinophagaceae bacterium]
MKTFITLIALVIAHFAGMAQTKITGWHFDIQQPTGTPALLQHTAEDGLPGILYLDGTNGSSAFIPATDPVALGSPVTGEVANFSGGGPESDDREKPYSGSPGLQVTYMEAEATNGKSMVFTLPSTGYSDLILNYYHSPNPVGFSNHTWAYSTNGTDFTDITTINTTSSGVQTVDLSTFSVLNNIPKVYLRLTLSGASNRIVGPYTLPGQSSIDNVSVTGMPLPSNKQKIAAWYFDTDYGAPSAPGWEFPAEFGNATLYANGTNGSSSFDDANGTNLVQFEGMITNNDRQPAEKTLSFSVHNLDRVSEIIEERRKSVVFKFSAAGYRDMQLSYAAYQPTSYRAHNWAYSTDGVNFTPIGTSFQVTSGKKIIDLSSYSALNNSPEIYLRLRFEYLEGAGGLDQGETVVDNVIIAGAEIPPPPAPRVKMVGWHFDKTLDPIPLKYEAEDGLGTLYADGTNGSSLFIASSELAKDNSHNGVNYTDDRPMKQFGTDNFLRVNNYTESGNTSSGKSLVLTFSTLGYENLGLKYYGAALAAGLKIHTWEYSTNGTDFYPAGDPINVEVANWSISNPPDRILDLSAITALNNMPKVYLRLTISGDENLAAGEFLRMDDFIVKGSPTSTPSIISTWYFDKSVYQLEKWPATTGNGTLYADGTNGSSTFTPHTEIDQSTWDPGLAFNDNRPTPNKSHYLSVKGLSLLSEELSGRRKSVVFTFNATAYKDLLLTYGAYNIPDFERNHTWAYSTDGVNFTDISTLRITAGKRVVDLSPYTALNNNTTVYLRLRFEAGDMNSDEWGGDMLDNVVISGTHIPGIEIPAAPLKALPIAGWHFDKASGSAPYPKTYEAEDGSGTLYVDGTNGSSVFTDDEEFALNAPGEYDDREKSYEYNGGGISITPVEGVTINKTMVFKVSATGYKDLVLTYYGFTPYKLNDHVWAYSLDGSGYTDIGSISVNTLTPDGSSIPLRGLDLSAITALNNAPQVYLRLTLAGEGDPDDPNYYEDALYMDNMVIEGTPVETLPKIAAWYFDEFLGPFTIPGREYPASIGNATLYANGTNGSSTFGGGDATSLDHGVNMLTNDDRANMPAESFGVSVLNMASMSTNIEERRKSVVFKFPATGYKDMQLSYVLYSHPNIGRNHNWAYSTDGVNFTPIRSFPATSGRKTIDLSGITALNGAPEVYLRLRFEATNNATDNGSLGVNTVDNVIISGRLASALPVSLTTFTARKVSDGVTLEWTTASEQNNAYFEVLRSADSRNFSVIGRVEGAGTTSATNHYTLTDHAPLTGTNYYRLKQTDYDGKTTYSDIVTVRYMLDAGNVSATVYSNGSSVNLRFSSPVSGASAVNIYDMQGRLLSRGNYRYTAGQNTISIPANLASGVYVLTFESSHIIFTKKFAALR